MIPKDELHIHFARSGGPGGQNVNKVNTKAVVRWSLILTRAFSNVQKNILFQKLAPKLTNTGELVVSSDDSRSQLHNKQKAIQSLENIVKKALYIPKKRVGTKPTRSSKEKRLHRKSQRSKLKKARSRSIVDVIYE